MSWNPSTLVRRSAGGAAMVAVLLLGATASYAQATASAGDGSTGRIDFAAADLPPANVEVDLTPETFGGLFGLSEAAISGIAESLSQTGDPNEATEIAAEKLAAAQKILLLAKEVVREVHVRVYKEFSEETDKSVNLAARFDEQLRTDDWNNVVKVRDGNESVRVSLLQKGDAIRGLFVVAAEGNEVVVVNVMCDASPENVKKLAAAATKIGLENGLQQLLEQKMKHLH